MATTQNEHNGDGSDRRFSFTFPYIKEEDVRISLRLSEANVSLLPTTAYTFPTATEIQFNAVAETDFQEATGAPKTGVTIRIFRDTDLETQRVTFFPGSSIRAQDLNDSVLQTLYANQERENRALDKTGDSMTGNLNLESDLVFEGATDDDFETTLTVVDPTADRTITFPDITGTVVTTADTGTVTTTMIANGTIANIDIDASADIDGSKLAAGTVDLDRIKAADIITEAEANPNNDTTIATTAKITDMIDSAITTDIATDNTGITVTNDGDGTITLGLANIDLDRIKADDVVTLAEQNAGPTADDDSIFTTSAAARRFDTIVQTGTPAGSVWETGKTWLQNDDDQTLKIWNGSTWLDVASGGSFRTQDKVIYVDATGGDDSKTGHRISGPKLTIKGAIEDINADISLSTEAADGFDGGSGYDPGDYTTVALTHSSGTGIGTGATADITVGAGGDVTSVTINTASDLEEYSIGDVLTADDADLGGLGGSGLLIPIIGGGDGMTVIVAAGVYQETAPIQIKRRNVSIVGMALRSTLVHPTVATQGDQSVGNHALFELNSGSFIQNLTLTGMKANNSGNNTLDAALPDRQGWNFAFFDGCFIEKSPYIQNCTNFSDSEIDNSDLRAHRPRGGGAGDTDSLPTGGGLLVDGSVPATTSPIRSMVADSYTHVGLNGPGILVTNNGYTQITSSYAFFNKYHIKCLNGGQANLAASTSDFGERSLIADGKSTAAIFTSNVDTAAAVNDTTFNINEPTAGVGWFGSTERPAENMLVEVTNSDATTSIYPILSAAANVDSEGGAGWTVTISNPDPNDRSDNEGLEKALDDDAAVSFFLRSQIASSGHTMEYVGSGTNYNALPENGGVPDETRQITELNNGKIWTAITDHNGKFRIGGNQTDDPFFEVDQQLGLVTIPEGSISFNLLSDETPQLGGDLDVNDFKITSANDGNVHIGPNGTGKIRVDAAITTNAHNSIILEPHGNGKVEVTANILKNSTDANSNLVLEPKGTGSVDVSSSKITSVSDPTASSDAATKNYVDNNFVADAGGTMSGDLTLGNQSDLRFGEATANGSNWVAFQAPGTIESNVTWTLPATDATVNGHALKSDGSGNLSWGTAGGASGGGTNQVFYEHEQNVTDDYTITANRNALTAGPITIDSGVTVTVPASSNWTIV